MAIDDAVRTELNKIDDIGKRAIGFFRLGDAEEAKILGRQHITKILSEPYRLDANILIDFATTLGLVSDPDVVRAVDTYCTDTGNVRSGSSRAKYVERWDDRTRRTYHWRLSDNVLLANAFALPDRETIAYDAFEDSLRELNWQPEHPGAIIQALETILANSNLKASDYTNRTTQIALNSKIRLSEVRKLKEIFGYNKAALKKEDITRRVAEIGEEIASRSEHVSRHGGDVLKKHPWFGSSMDGYFHEGMDYLVKCIEVFELTKEEVRDGLYATVKSLLVQVNCQSDRSTRRVYDHKIAEIGNLLKIYSQKFEMAASGFSDEIQSKVSEAIRKDAMTLASLLYMATGVAPASKDEGQRMLNWMIQRGKARHEFREANYESVDYQQNLTRLATILVAEPQPVKGVAEVKSGQADISARVTEKLTQDAIAVVHSLQIQGRNVDAYELMKADFFKAEQKMPVAARQNVVSGAYKEILAWWYPSAQDYEGAINYIPELQTALGPEACKKVALEALDIKADKLVAEATNPHRSGWLHSERVSNLHAYMAKFGVDITEATPCLLRLYSRLQPSVDKNDPILERLATAFNLGEHDPTVRTYMDAKRRVAEAVGAQD